MPEVPRILTIPTALNALDADTYANDGGCPTHAALGRQLARNDRCLHANLRRTHVNQAFAINDLPRFSFYHGCSFGPFPAPCTPWVREGDWRLRLSIPNTTSVIFVPFAEGLLPYAGRPDPSADAVDFEQTLTGTGAEATYGPYVTPLQDVMPPMAVGFVLLSTLTTTSPTTGSVVDVFPHAITGAAGAFAGLPSAPTERVIRLLDSGTGAAVSGWHDIFEVRGANNQHVDIWPALSWDEIRNAPADLDWQMREITRADVYSYTLREVPLSGDLNEVR